MARVRFRFTINIVTIGVYIQYIVTNYKIFLSNDTFMVTFDLLLKLTHKKIQRMLSKEWMFYARHVHKLAMHCTHSNIKFNYLNFTLWIWIEVRTKVKEVFQKTEWKSKLKFSIKRRPTPSPLMDIISISISISSVAGNSMLPWRTTSEPSYAS